MASAYNGGLGALPKLLRVQGPSTPLPRRPPLMLLLFYVFFGFFFWGGVVVSLRLPFTELCSIYRKYSNIKKYIYYLHCSVI